MHDIRLDLLEESDFGPFLCREDSVVGRLVTSSWYIGIPKDVSIKNGSFRVRFAPQAKFKRFGNSDALDAGEVLMDIKDVICANTYSERALPFVLDGPVAKVTIVTNDVLIARSISPGDWSLIISVRRVDTVKVRTMLGLSNLLPS